MGQIKFITSMAMISLFAIAIISYTINFGSDNDANILLSDDSDFSNLNTNLNTEILTYKNTTNSSGISIFDSKIESQEVTTTTGNPLQQISTIFDSFKLITNTISNKIFGGKGGEFGIIMTGFVTLISIIGILVAWKTWVGRNPD
jgi:hypothetical protein|tara:strand:+ start:792 stop:1226 length:435 start_codon:yes stop_codon:yes gene_type:complete